MAVEETLAFAPPPPPYKKCAELALLLRSSTLVLFDELLEFRIRRFKGDYIYYDCLERLFFFILITVLVFELVVDETALVPPCRLPLLD